MNDFSQMRLFSWKTQPAMFQTFFILMFAFV